MTEEQLRRVEKAAASIIRALGYMAENQIRAAYQQSFAIR